MVLAGFELIRLAQVHLVHLRVVFDFARLHQAGIERLLLVRRIAVDAMRVEQIWPRSVRTTTGSQWPGSRSTRMSRSLGGGAGRPNGDRRGFGRGPSRGTL